MKTVPESFLDLADSAFPVSIKDGPSTVTNLGLTKRELFAAMAMQGILANPNTYKQDDPDVLAVFAKGYADALITQLNASKGEG